MSKKNDIIFPVTLLLFAMVELFLVKSGQNQLGIYLYILYSGFLFMMDKKYIISFFVYHIPLLPIVATDYKIFSFVGPHEVIYGFSFFVLSTLVRNSKNKKLSKIQKISIAFVYFLFFMKMYELAKDILLGIHSDNSKNLFYIFKNFVRYYLYYISVVLLIKVIYQKDVRNYVIEGIKYAIITIPISMIYTRELILMGTGVNFAPERLDIILSGEYQRFVGFYGAGGDENSVGIFMVGAFGFFLALYEKTGNMKKYIVFLGFAVLGVLLSGSRTSFIALSLVVLIFLITNKSGKSKFGILAAIVIFYFAFSKQLNLVIERFLDPSAAKAIDPEDEGRVGKWIFYTAWIIDNPITLFFGNLERIPYKRAPHNYFIYIVYHTGLGALIFFIKYLVKLFKSVTFSLKPYMLKNAYYVLPFPFIIMTVNSFGSSIYLWLYLPIGAFFITEETLKTKTKSVR